MPHYLLDVGRVREVFHLAGWQTFVAFAEVVRGQGVSVLVNLFFGPRMNASLSVANTVSGRCQTFSNEIQGAFAPAICSAYGAADRKLAQTLAARCDKMSALVMMLFSIPLCFEADYIMKLWLETPPLYSSTLCICIFLQEIIDKTTSGEYEYAVATGRLRLFQGITGCLVYLICPLIWVSFYFGATIYAVVVVRLIIGALVVLTRVIVLQLTEGVSLLNWLRCVFCPLSIVGGVGVLVCLGVQSVLCDSILRVGVSYVLGITSMMAFSWKFVLSWDERIFITERALSKFGRFVKVKRK